LGRSLPLALLNSETLFVQSLLSAGHSHRLTSGGKAEPDMVFEAKVS
jgi:hypothetical protein